MKHIFTILPILLFSFEVHAQSIVCCSIDTSLVKRVGMFGSFKNRHVYFNPQKPSVAYRYQLFVSEAAVLPNLYASKDFDRIRLYMDSITNQSAGFWRYHRAELAPHFYALLTLLSIETGHFSPLVLSDSGFQQTLIHYARIMRQMNRRGNSGLLESYFDPSVKGNFYNCQAYSDVIITLIHNWAEHLLTTRQLTPVDSFMCRLFTGEIKHPVNKLLSEKKEQKELGSRLERSYSIDRREGSFVNFSLSGGAWIPTGELKSLGIHPLFGCDLVGLRNRKNELNIYFSGKFLRTAQDYLVNINDTLYTGKKFYGAYYGVDYTRYLISHIHFEAGLLAGFGGDNLEFFPKAKTNIFVWSTNLNAGIRINYFFDRYTYLGLTGKYNILNYKNPGGADFSGNAITAELTYGVNILIANRKR